MKKIASLMQRSISRFPTSPLVIAVAVFAAAGFGQTASPQGNAKRAADAVTGDASTISVRLDPSRTAVQFSAGTLRRIHGTFQLKTGVFALDAKSGMAQGEILVDAASEKSNDAKLDRKIAGETLESGKYPGIFFHVEKVEGHLPVKDGEQHLKLIGTFNIHGGDHPLTVDVDAVNQGQQLTLRSSFVVPYVQWGMKDASTLLMRDRNIRITIVSQATSERLEAKP